jgi:hypothetical protein
MTKPKTRAVLIQMAQDFSDLRFARGLYCERTFQDAIAQGRAWSELEAALRDCEDPESVRAARKAEIERMFAWERFHNDRARCRLDQHPVSWINGALALMV